MNELGRLRIEEIPQELVTCFDLSRQERRNGNWVVANYCRLCNALLGGYVSNIRKGLQEGTFSSLCVSCVRMRPLKQEEIPKELREFYPIHKQQLQEKHNGFKELRICAICIGCNKERWIPVKQVRAACKKKSLKGCCGNCRAGELSSRWSGGSYISGDGYLYLYRPEHPYARKNYVLEHRLIMEEHLGRYLTPIETVHHKNGIRDDNRLENLELWVGNHKHGQRYNDLNLAELIDLRDYINTLIDECSLEEAGCYNG